MLSLDNKNVVIGTTLIHALHASACFLLGYIFLTARQLSESIELYSVLCLCLVIALVSADYGWRWKNFVSGETKRGLPAFLCPSLGGLFLYCITSGNPFEQSCNIFVLIVCSLYAFLFTRLNYLLSHPESLFDSKMCSTQGVSAQDIDMSSRLHSRFVVVMPLFVLIQSTLLGCSLVMASHSNPACIAVYILAMVYYILWKKTINLKRETLEKVNGGLLLLILAYFVCYFITYYTQKDNHQFVEWFALVSKVLALSIVCGCAVSIPALTDLSEIMKGKSDHINSYVRHRRLLSLITGVIAMFLPVAWSLIRLSRPLLMISTIAIMIWVHIVTFRRENGQQGHIAVASLLPMIAIGFLCAELMGIFDKFDSAAFSTNTPISSEIIALVEFIAVVFGGILDRGVTKSFIEKIKEFQIFEVTLISNAITTIILIVLPALGADVVRVNFASAILVLQTVFQITFWLLGTHRVSPKSKGQHTQEEDEPSNAQK